MNPIQVTSNGSGDFITQLHPNDVLFGRGSGPNDHEGNIRFRSLIGERKVEYMATNHRQTKAKIARDIVGTVLQKNGRFLKKVEAAEAKRLGIPKGLDAWIRVDEETIMEKAKQALRQQRDKGKPEGLSPNSSPVPSARKTHAVPITSSSEDGDPYGVGTSASQSPTGATAEGGLVGANEAALRQVNHMRNVAEHAQPSQLVHPSPYEPIPIGYNALGPNNTNLDDWRNNAVNYAATAIMGQTQGLPQQDYTHAQHQQQQPTPQLDISNVAGEMHMPPPESRGESRRESIQMSDLMDSFNKLKASKELDSQYGSTDTIGTINNESTDTMGTIEPMHAGQGKVTSEVATSSSTFSIMRGALEGSSQLAMLKGYGDSAIDSKLFSADQLFPPEDSRRSSTNKSSARRDSSSESITIDDKDFFRKASRPGASSSEMSMSFSQVWTEKRPGNLGNVTEGDETLDDFQKKVAPGAPRAVNAMEDDPDGMSGLGKSSMSILNIAMGESQGESIMTANESIFSDIGD